MEQTELVATIDTLDGSLQRQTSDVCKVRLRELPDSPLQPVDWLIGPVDARRNVKQVKVVIAGNGKGARRLPAVIDAGDPAVLCSHWQGFCGLHERDPRGERTCWRKPSAITTYACMREMAFEDGTFVAMEDEGGTLLAFTPNQRQVRVVIDGEDLSQRSLSQ